MRNLLIVTLAIGLFVGFFYWNSQRQHVETWALYESDTLGFTFEYRTDPNGYIINELDKENIDYDNLIEGLILMLESDYQSVLSGERDGGEGPPTINIFAFSNPNNL